MSLKRYLITGSIARFSANRQSIGLRQGQGIAAIMLDGEHRRLDAIRRRASSGGAEFETMMRSVRRMMPGVAAGKDYVAVFEMGEVK
jgi:hypothetical protein